jgi:hypothetical protein
MSDHLDMAVSVLPHGPRQGIRVIVRNLQGKYVSAGTFIGYVSMSEAVKAPVAACLQGFQFYDVSSPELRTRTERFRRAMQNGSLTALIVLDDNAAVFGYQCIWEGIGNPETPPTLQ